ncbi:MAG: glycosyltransferase family 4 protein [Chloroflexota bacterium]
MNILFVHEVDWMKKVVFEIHNLAETLSSLGHKVYAIDYENTWQRNGVFRLGSLRTKNFEVSRAVPGASVSLRRPGFIKVPGLSRLSAGFTHYQEIQKTIREKQIDVIMLYSVPTNGLQTIFLAKKHHIPVIFRSIDILHRLVSYPALRLPTKLMERRVYASADEILAITPNHRHYVISMGAPEAKVKLLPLPIDTSLFHPSVDYNDVRKKWGLTGQDQVIVFIGTLFEFSGLDGFLRQFPRVLADVPKVKLLIVGDGPQRQKLESIITELDLANRVIMTGFQPYSTMPQYINLATVCINPFLNTNVTRDIFPGKIIQYIACGKATVATPLLGITALIPDNSSGIIYANRPEDMAREVINLLKSTEYRQKIEQAGLDYVRQVHDQRKIARQLEAELMGLVEKNKNRGKDS